MTFLVERLAELERYLDHLDGLRSRVKGAAVLERDLSLKNDVLFSLLMTAQLVIDISGELLSRRGEPFDDYTDSVRKLASDERFDSATAEVLQRLPGFRNVIVHDYVSLDVERVVTALDNLDPIRTFVSIVAKMERDG